MPFIKEARVRIESRIENLDDSGLPVGDSERADTECAARYKYSEDGECEINYTERGAGGEIFTSVCVNDGEVSVTRRGAIESAFSFEMGKEHSSVYSVPPYKFDVSVIPRRLGVHLDAEGGSVDLLYNMRIGGADKAVRMKIWIQAN